MSDKPQKPSKPSDHIDDQATEKKALNPDVAEKSQTDAKGKAEIDKEITNASSGSLGFDEGITAIRFEIDDDGETIASKDVRSEQADFDDSENDSESLTVELEALKKSDNKIHSELAQNIEVMRTQAKEKGISTEAIDEYAKETFSKSAPQENQFERGSHKALSTEPTDQKPLDPSEHPVGGFEQETREDGGITLKAGISKKTENNWQTIVEKVSELPLDQQLQIIATGLEAFDNELNRQKLEIVLGTVEGVGEGFKSLGDGVISLANGLGQIGQFSADVMTNNPRAIETSANAGEAIGKTLVSGVRLFQMSHDYLYNIGFTGDYAKPFKDIANLGNELNKRWAELPPREQAKLTSKMATEVFGSLAIPVGVSKLSKTGKITAFMEELATQASTVGGKAKSKAIEVITETVDGLAEGMPSLGPEFVPASGPSLGRPKISDRIKEQLSKVKEKTSNFMNQADDIGGAGKNPDISKKLDAANPGKSNSLENAFEKLEQTEKGKFGDPYSEFGERINPERIGMTDRLHTLSSWLRVEESTAKFEIEYIRSNFSKKNTFRDTIEQVAKIARSYGAETLEVAGQGFNEKLKEKISKWYSDSFVDLGKGKGYRFTVPLKEK